MRKRWTRCVGYLPERVLQAWNKMLKLSFIYMKQSFAFVQLDSSCIFLPMGSRNVVWMMELLYAAPRLFIFFPAKGYWTTNTLGILKGFFK